MSRNGPLDDSRAEVRPKELEQARHFRSSDPKAAAILAFADAVVRTTGGVGDSDIQAAREVGLTDAELGDVVGHVAVNVLTNYFNRAFDVEVDFPLVEPHQHVTAG